MRRTLLTRFGIAFTYMWGFLVTVGAQPPKESANRLRVSCHDSLKISPRYRDYVKAVFATNAAPIPGKKVSTVAKGGRTYAVLNVEYHSAKSCADFKVKGAMVITKVDRFADLFVDDLDALSEVEKTPGVRWMEFAAIVKIPPPPRVGPPTESRATPEPIIRGGIGVTGKNVIVAIVDTGIDFRHPDFIKRVDGKPTSRLLYYWDTLAPGTATRDPDNQPLPTYPNGAPIGVVYSRDELTRELQEPKGLLPDPDEDGHGTACAGIAAGNGAGARKRTGVAPDADLIAVRIGKKAAMDNAYLLGRISAWIVEKASLKDKPIVISCSFGAQIGARDGSRIDERQLDSRFPKGLKGRAICIAAGNDGATGLHASATFGGPGRTGILKWTSLDPTAIELYLDTDSREDLWLEAPVGLKLNCWSYLHGITKQRVVELELPAGPGQLSIHNTSGKPMTAEAYIMSNGDGAPAQFTAGIVKGRQISTPGTAGRAITVASYDFNDQFDGKGGLVTLGDADRGNAPLMIGGISTYSNPGRVLEEKDDIKPDICSPGQYFLAPAVKQTPGEFLDASGMYQLFNGTSAATPYTAGVIALMMESNRDLTMDQIRELFTRYQQEKERKFTDTLPNIRWGRGKLSLDAVTQMFGDPVLAGRPQP